MIEWRGSLENGYIDFEKNNQDKRCALDKFSTRNFSRIDTLRLPRTR